MLDDKFQLFTTAYRIALAKAIERDPQSYHYSTPDEIAEVADKMTRALADGKANLGPAGKAAARKLGIKPTQSAIKSYLNGRE